MAGNRLPLLAHPTLVGRGPPEAKKKRPGMSLSESFLNTEDLHPIDIVDAGRSTMEGTLTVLQTTRLPWRSRVSGRDLFADARLVGS